MYRYFLGAALLLSAAARAQTAPTASVLTQADKLTTAQQYEAAYALLDKADPQNQQPDVVLAKEKLLLSYYLISVNYKSFGLKNLQPGETVAQLRGQKGPYSMHLLDIPKELKRLQQKSPQNYALSKGLGDYYYQAQQCHCGERDKTDAQLLALVLRYYGSAHAHGVGDFMSYYAVGYALLMQKKPEPSLAAFEQSIALNAEYPTSHYNLAFAQAQLGRWADATPHAQAAYRLYPDPELKADAARLLGHLYLQQKQPAEAKVALQQSLDLQPRSYASLLQLLQLAVAERSPTAPELATRLYQLDPADDQMFVDIMDTFQAANQWTEAEAVFRSQLPTAPKTPAAQGLLHFYLAILNMQLQRPKEARPHFLTAQTQLRKVAKPDNPMFELIEKGLKETRP
ncbi:tetratricopeptide repeat protein [Hymenobacter lutimineralis]|uniref:Tetratricopeptide repeat protein n=1 Tax=Hymenobacter lutimineralis TaxID=2606448 RepID=A0A5D6V877_9BACT|nr:tetratricopeptide repeat protein [Hymenobacter lutimineralis]TYZ11415.1 tetratricopeptide repeat protein [Hymenobacter lutimineralis]